MTLQIFEHVFLVIRKVIEPCSKLVLDQESSSACP